MQTIVTYAGYITAIAAAITAIVVPIRKAINALKAPIAEIKVENAKQSAAIAQLSDDVSRLAGDRLNQAHEYYTQRGWCPGSKKRELEDWYNAYKAGGHNHLADHYIDELIALPENPEEVK